MKYVIFESKGGLYNPVVFPDHIAHSQIKIEDCSVFSAGFLELSTFGVKRCYGESISLNVKSKGNDDEEIIQRWFLNMGTSAFLKYSL